MARLLCAQTAELDEQTNHLRNELNREKHTASEELRITSEANAAKTASLERAVADARALHEQSSREVEGLLKSQEELADKYRAEAKTVAERSETLVAELRAESERLTIRNAEVTATLSHMTAANHGLERADRDMSNQLAIVKKQLAEVQAVRAQQGGLLTQLREAEKAWTAEKRVLMRQLRAEHAVAGATAAPYTTGAPRSTAKPIAVASGRPEKVAAAAEVEAALARARLSAIPGSGSAQAAQAAGA